MKIALYQFAPLWGNVQGNLKKIESILCRHTNIDLWILPELCTTGYLFNSKAEIGSIAEPFPGGQTDSWLLSITKRLNTSVIMSVAEKCNKKLYNSAVVFDNGAHVGAYRKIHLFDNEKNLFDPGNKAPAVFTVRGVRVGVMICFDWIFPEAARTLALNGAQIIAHPANLVLTYCPDAMVTRSIENMIFTATANRIGTERLSDGQQLTYIGNSQVTNTFGKRLGRLSKDREGVLIVDIDPAESNNKSITKNNDLFLDRKPELYRLK